MRELQYIFLFYVNKDLIFLGHFSCHWTIAIDWPTSHLKNFPKGFPGGVWTLRVSNSHISSNSLYQMSVHSNQTEPELHQPGVTLQMKQKAKRCPEIKSQVARVPPKAKTKQHKCRTWLPSPLGLWPGSHGYLCVSAGSIFSSDSFKQFRADFLRRNCSINSSFRSF